MKKRLVGVTRFKAQYSALLTEAQRGGSITISKNGRPVAILGPPPATRKSTKNTLTGRASIVNPKK